MPSTMRVRLPGKGAGVAVAIRNPPFPMTLDLPIMGRSTPILGLWRMLPIQRQLALGLGEKGAGDLRERSDEHTSELQSLMRISYAVFCFNKKKNNNANPLNSA